ncbi:CP2B5 protein, partial [Atractosteus spatula]|nr:CP2B5 protein [Atractosteus spatula]
MELIVTLALGAFTLLLAVLLKQRRTVQQNLPPGPLPLPVIGNLLQLDRKALFKSFVKLSKTYGPVLTVYFGVKRVVVLVGFKTVQEALVDKAEQFAGRAPIPVLSRINKGYGLGTSNGERWRQLREFTFRTLRDFITGQKRTEQSIQEEAKHLAKELCSAEGTPCEPTNLLNLAGFNVICSLVFGERFDYKDPRFAHLLRLLSEMISGVRGPWGQLYNTFPKLLEHLPGPHRQIFSCAEQLADFLMEEICTHKKTLNPSCPRDFIDCFLLKMEQEKDSSSTEFHYNNMIYTILGLFIAGAETTSTTLRYALMLVIKHPHVQERIQKEIDAVIGAQRHPALEDLKAMPFTNAVIHEVQRLLDVVPMNLPHMATQNVSFRGYTIPAGTTVIPLLHSVLRDEEQWASPDSFYPQHFLNGDGSFKKNPAFLVFSAGHRSCAGESLAYAEIFIMFTSLLQKFSFTCPGGPHSLDVTPVPSSFENIPQAYQLIATSR